MLIRDQIRAKNRASTPDEIEWRRRDNEAGAKARADREARYPEITAENFQEANDFQEDRRRFHRGEN